MLRHECPLWAESLIQANDQLVLLLRPHPLVRIGVQRQSSVPQLFPCSAGKVVDELGPRSVLAQHADELFEPIVLLYSPDGFFNIVSRLHFFRHLRCLFRAVSKPVYSRLHRDCLPHMEFRLQVPPSFELLLPVRLGLFDALLCHNLH